MYRTSTIRSKLALSLLAMLALALAAGQSYAAAYNFTTIDDPSGVNGTLPSGIDGNNVVGGYYDATFTPNGFLYNTSTSSLDDDRRPVGSQGHLGQRHLRQ